MDVTSGRRGWTSTSLARLSLLVSRTVRGTGTRQPHDREPPRTKCVLMGGSSCGRSCSTAPPGPWDCYGTAFLRLVDPGTSGRLHGRDTHSQYYQVAVIVIFLGSFMVIPLYFGGSLAPRGLGMHESHLSMRISVKSARRNRLQPTR